MSELPSIIQLRDHVRVTQRNPKDRKASYTAIIAFEKLMAASRFSEKDLRPIIAAAFHRHRGPMHIGTELLATLSKNNEIACQVWRNKAKSPQAHERRIAVAFMQDRRIPHAIALEIVTNALNDKSAAVREFAISAGKSRGLTELYSCLRLQSKGQPSAI